MSLEHLKGLIEEEAQDGRIYDYSDVELTVALLQEKIDNLDSRGKEKLRVIIEAELARDLNMQCITTKIHDEISAGLAWAWRTWEKEYVAEDRWRLEQGAEEMKFLIECPYHHRQLIGRKVKRLILPRLQAKVCDQRPHQDRLGRPKVR